MKSNVSLATAFLALLFPVTGMAQFYLGAGIGSADAHLSTNSGVAGLSVSNLKKRDTGYRLLGGYEFKDTWGLELGYADLGKFSYNFSGLGLSGTSVDDRNAWYAAGTARIAFTPSLSGRVRLGLSRNRASDSVSGNAAFITAASAARVPLTGTTRRTTVMGGLGLQYDFNRTIGLRFDYDNFGRFGDDSVTDRSRIDMWSGNLVFKF